MKRRSGWAVMARLVVLVRPMVGYMLLAIAMGLAGHLCASFITILGGYAVLDVLGQGAPISLNMLFACVVVFALMRALLRYGEQACNHFIAFKLLAILRDRVFRALRRLAPAKLEGRDKGNLIAVITSDIELLEVFYAHTLSPLAIAALFTVVMCLFIGSFHGALGLLALAAYAVVGVVIPLAISRSSGDSGLVFRTQSGELSAFVLDSLRGLSETQQYGQGAKRLAQMNARTDALAQTEARMKRIAGRNNAVTGAAILAFDLAMLLAGTALYRAGQVGYAGVLIPTIALFSSFGPVVALAALGSTLQNTFAAGNRVLDILDEQPVAPDIERQEPISFDGAAARHVHFAYGEETILDNVSVDIPKNAVVGITGRSGSGKSTLLKLLMRFWRVQSGEVSLSGRNIERVNTRDLRDMESFVTQETQLFHDSIRNNLRLAKLDATDAEIEAACRKASVHDFIMTLPCGYDTPVGELGDTLSGGERQRLGIPARCALHAAGRTHQQSGQPQRSRHSQGAAKGAQGQDRRAGLPQAVHHAHG